MNQSTYTQYTSLVESKQMRLAAERFFHPCFTIFKDGHEYSDMEAFLRVKDIQYHYMHETIKILSFYAGTDGFVVETLYGWHADQDVLQGEFEREGCPEGYIPLRKGESKETHCVFFYETRGEKFTRVRVYELD